MDVEKVNVENLNLRKIQGKLLQWENKLAPLTSEQTDLLYAISQVGVSENVNLPFSLFFPFSHSFPFLQESDETPIKSDVSKFSPIVDTYTQIVENKRSIESLQDFLELYNISEMEMENLEDQVYLDYYGQLKDRTKECDNLLAETDICLDALAKLTSEYNFVSNKTSSLHTASEKLLQDQYKLNELANEIRKRLNFYTRVENIHQRLQNPTFSVAGDTFIEILNSIDESMEYIRVHVSMDLIYVGLVTSFFVLSVQIP